MKSGLIKIVEQNYDIFLLNFRPSFVVDVARNRKLKVLLWNLVNIKLKGELL